MYNKYQITHNETVYKVLLLARPDCGWHIYQTKFPKHTHTQKDWFLLPCFKICILCLRCEVLLNISQICSKNEQMITTSRYIMYKSVQDNISHYYCSCVHCQLTLSSPVVSNDYISKCLGEYWSNRHFLIFWHSGTPALKTKRRSAWMSKN